MIKQRKQVKTGPLSYLCKMLQSIVCIPVPLWLSIVKERIGREKRSALSVTCETAAPTTPFCESCMDTVCEFVKTKHSFLNHVVAATLFSQNTSGFTEKLNTMEPRTCSLTKIVHILMILNLALM